MCFAPEPGELYLSVLGCSSFEGEQPRHQEEDQASAKPAGCPHPDDEDEGEDEQVDNCVQHLHLVQGDLLTCCLKPSSTHPCSSLVLPAGNCSLPSPGCGFPNAREDTPLPAQPPLRKTAADISIVNAADSLGERY